MRFRRCKILWHEHESSRQRAMAEHTSPTRRRRRREGRRRGCRIRGRALAAREPVRAIQRALAELLAEIARSYRPQSCSSIAAQQGE